MVFVAPTVVSGVFTLIILISSFIFKMIFKIQGCNGFGTGICCFIITALIIVILCVVFFLILYYACDYGKISQNPTKTSITFCSLFAAIHVTVFTMLYCFIKRIKDEAYSIALMFCSGYIFLTISIFILFDVVGILNGKLGTWKTFLSDELITYSVLAFGFILETCSIILMIFLHHKKANCLIIILTLSFFFGPLIIQIILLFVATSIQFGYIIFGIHVVGLILGLVCFCIYYKKDPEKEILSQNLIPLQGTSY